MVRRQSRRASSPRHLSPPQASTCHLDPESPHWDGRAALHGRLGDAASSAQACRPIHLRNARALLFQAAPFLCSPLPRCRLQARARARPLLACPPGRAHPERHRHYSFQEAPCPMHSPLFQFGVFFPSGACFESWFCVRPQRRSAALLRACATENILQGKELVKTQQLSSQPCSAAHIAAARIAAVQSHCATSSHRQGRAPSARASATASAAASGQVGGWALVALRALGSHRAQEGKVGV